MGLNCLFKWLLIQFHVEMNFQDIVICNNIFFFFKGKHEKKETNPELVTLLRHGELQQKQGTKKMNRTSPMVS